MNSESTLKQQFATWRQKADVSTQNTSHTLSDWSDYVRNSANNLYQTLPINNANPQAIEEPEWFKLGRLERLVGFFLCLSVSLFCFVICFFMFPVLALKPRKIGLLWTMGSVLFVVSFGVLQGPYHFIRHITSRERIVFTTIFLLSVASTLYSAVVIKSTLMTIVSSIFELFAVAYYGVSYFPFGAALFRWFTSYLVGYVGGFIGALL